MKVSIILAADSYKFSHYKLFPQNTKNNNSYIESRGIDKDSGLPESTEIVFFGLQAYIKEYLLTPVTKQDITKAKKLILAHGLPFNEEDWNIIVEEFNGYLPLVIEALPEGTPISPGVAMVQVRATDERFAWLASFVETSILRAVWYPTTVATVSREAKKIIKHYLDMTAETPDSELPFKLHDFGGRGVSSSESAQLGAAAHLVNFMGTDTVEGLIAVQEYYNTDEVVGFSVPASEHSTITSWGRDGEFDAYANMIEVFGKPGAIVSCVSDSYDIYNACANLWPRLKDRIEELGCTLVVRPDSGNAEYVVPKIAGILSEKFGFTLNSKGYKVIKNVRILQGDGIDLHSIGQILRALVYDGFSTENVVFGMGGALLQKVNRDTLKFAMKTSAIRVGNVWRDVYKEPIDTAFKKSKKGIQVTFRDTRGKILTESYPTMHDHIDEFLLKQVYHHGIYTKTPTTLEYTFDEVRKNAEVK